MHAGSGVEARGPRGQARVRLHLRQVRARVRRGVRREPVFGGYETTRGPGAGGGQVRGRRSRRACRLGVHTERRGRAPQDRYRDAGTRAMGGCARGVARGSGGAPGPPGALVATRQGPRVRPGCAGFRRDPLGFRVRVGTRCGYMGHHSVRPAVDRG